MKKVKVLAATAVLSLALAYAAAAESNGSGTPQAAAADTGQTIVQGQGETNGPNGQPPLIRPVTPDMNAREKVETQRAIYKRAAASRNALIRAAELERRQQSQNAGNGGAPLAN